jgi:adenosine/AMP kinase
MEIESVPLELPEGANVIVGQSHFIKTVEDLAEIASASLPGGRFGLAFNEASGPCLVRVDGNDAFLQRAAAEAALAIGAGHVFVLILSGGYPVQLLDRIKQSPEVCTVFCATANQLEVLVARTAWGRGVVGVIDGERPKRVENADEARARHELLRELGYKR